MSTVGVSGFINPDGSTTPVTELFTAAQPVEEVVLHSGLTISDRLGPWVEWACGGLLVLAALGRLRRRPTGRVGRRSVSPHSEEATSGV